MDSKEMREFIKVYQDYITNVIEPTYEELKDLFHSWKSPTYWAKYSSKSRLPTPSPISRIHQRIKRPESAADKILRKQSHFPEGLSINSLQRMNDVLGGRVVVFFLSNLPLIDREIRNSEILEISKEAPPVAYLDKDTVACFALNHIGHRQKESGYASVHYVVRFRKSMVSKKERPWFEIQVRTLVEDIWGEIEHVLGYKPNKRTSFAVRRQFQILSTQLKAIDEHFNFLYSELLRFQEEVSFKESDPLNAENLAAVLNEVGIGCAQREINGLLKLLASRGIQTVADLLNEATPKRIETIRHVYLNHEGRSPNNFEIVANIATLRGIHEETAVTEAIKAQIDFLSAWEKLKKMI